MKKFTVFLALIASTSAFSDDLILGDLNYFQSKHTTLLNTSLSYSLGGFKEVTNTSSTKYNTSSIHFTNSASYGHSDKINFGLAVDYALRNRTTLEEGSELRTQEEGLSDFTLLANQRFWDETVYLDLMAGLTLGFGNAERVYLTDEEVTEGNNYQGHHSLSLAVATGRKWENNLEFRSYAGLDFHFPGEGELVQEGVSTIQYDSESFVNWIIGGAIQYRTEYRWAFSAGIDYRISGDRNWDLKSGTEDYKLKSDDYFTLSLMGKHNISEFILFNLGYQLTPSYSTQNKRGISSWENEQEMSHLFSIGGQVLF